jgi:hypothetical protein
MVLALPKAQRNSLRRAVVSILTDPPIHQDLSHLLFKRSRGLLGSHSL